MISELKPRKLIYGFQKQGGIVSTEAEGVAQHTAEFRFASRVRNAIEIALGILIFQIDRRRDDPLADRHGTRCELDAASGPE